MGDAALPSEALTEQFDRAQQYVERNVEEFSQEQQDSLEVRQPSPLLPAVTCLACWECMVWCNSLLSAGNQALMVGCLSSWWRSKEQPEPGWRV